eukprot:1577195-Amphidinium_carterae.1
MAFQRLGICSSSCTQITINKLVEISITTRTIDEDADFDGVVSILLRSKIIGSIEADVRYSHVRYSQALLHTGCANNSVHYLSSLRRSILCSSTTPVTAS